MRINRKWLPAVITPAIIASLTIAIPLQANAIDLPDLTPQEVMLLMETSKEIQGFSGKVVKTTNLGLPELEFSSMVSEDMVEQMKEQTPEGFEEFIPETLDASPLTDAITLIAGTHTARLYVSEQGSRLQILDPMGQRDIIVSPESVWMYDFDSAKATQVNLAGLAELLPKDYKNKSAPAKVDLDEIIAEASAKLEIDLTNPAALADYFVTNSADNLVLTVGKDHRVAGRTAYQLIATPVSEYSLIDSIVLSIDSEYGFPLDFKIVSTEQAEPALHVGFTDISFEVPSADIFSFTPPAGTTIETINLRDGFEELSTTYSEELVELENNVKEKASVVEEKYENTPDEEKELILEEIKDKMETAANKVVAEYLIGRNWDTVVHIDDAAALMDSELLTSPLIADILTPVIGGKAFSTPILNILIMDDGSVYMGAVELDYLVSLAAKF